MKKGKLSFETKVFRVSFALLLVMSAAALRAVINEDASSPTPEPGKTGDPSLAQLIGSELDCLDGSQYDPLRWGQPSEVQGSEANMTITPRDPGKDPIRLAYIGGVFFALDVPSQRTVNDPRLDCNLALASNSAAAS